MGFASKCSTFKLPERGGKISKLNIFDMRLISPDRVTYYHNSIQIKRHACYQNKDQVIIRVISLFIHLCAANAACTSVIIGNNRARYLIKVKFHQAS